MTKNQRGILLVSTTKQHSRSMSNMQFSATRNIPSAADQHPRKSFPMNKSVYPVREKSYRTQIKNGKREEKKLSMLILKYLLTFNIVSAA